jgi:hypothetical protein
MALNSPPYAKGTLVNGEKYIGLDVHQANGKKCLLT